jgi:hypothetical protein
MMQGQIGGEVNLPDLAGIWRLDGAALTPDGERLYEWEGRVTLTQQAQLCAVMLETLGERTSRSLSYAERLTALDDGQWALRYGYEMEPDSGAPPGYSYFGVSQLTFAADLQSAHGHSCNWNGTRYAVMELALTRAA